MKQITHHTEGHFLMDWYPDGKHLLVRCRRDHGGPSSERFYKIGSKTRGPEELVFDASGKREDYQLTGQRYFFTVEALVFTGKAMWGVRPLRFGNGMVRIFLS